MLDDKSILIYESYSGDIFQGYENPLISVMIEHYPNIPHLGIDSSSDQQLQNMSEQFISNSKRLLLIVYLGLNAEFRGFSKLLLDAKRLKEVTVVINQRKTLVEKIFEPQKIIFAEDWNEIINQTEKWIKE